MVQSHHPSFPRIGNKQQKAIFTGGTLRRRKSGRDTMIRSRCRRLHSSLGLKCRMVARRRSKTRIRKSPMSSTRSIRSLPGRKWRREWIMKMVGTMMMTCSLVRSCGHEA